MCAREAQELGYERARLQELGTFFAQNGVLKGPGGGVHSSTLGWRVVVCVLGGAGTASAVMCSCHVVSLRQHTHSQTYTPSSKTPSWGVESECVCVCVYMC